MGDAHAIARWRDAILGPQGPESHTTVLVLLVLAQYLERNGGMRVQVGAKEIAAAARLSEFGVLKHLAIAEKTGWLLRTRSPGNARRWKLYSYYPMFHGELLAQPHAGAAEAAR